jgi:hypothetical protein
VRESEQVNEQEREYKKGNKKFKSSETQFHEIKLTLIRNFLPELFKGENFVWFRFKVKILNENIIAMKVSSRMPTFQDCTTFTSYNLSLKTYVVGKP